MTWGKNTMTRREERNDMGEERQWPKDLATDRSGFAEWEL